MPKTRRDHPHHEWEVADAARRARRLPLAGVSAGLQLTLAQREAIAAPPAARMIAPGA